MTLGKLPCQITEIASIFNISLCIRDVVLHEELLPGENSEADITMGKNDESYYPSSAPSSDSENYDDDDDDDDDDADYDDIAEEIIANAEFLLR